MPLEAVMVCVDNSDYTRNGDYTPTRFISESDAVQIVCSSKTAQNPENSVGILTTAGDRVEVLVTPSTDLGRMVAEIAKVKIGGGSDLLRGIQTAQLALKHRQNKNQKQRIVAFVGSPITATERELEVLGKNLKKNNVSLDLVSFGEVDENQAKLDKLLAAVNSGDSSHVLPVPVGPKLLSDVLLSSPILSDGESIPAAAGGGGDAGFEFGIDPATDPELALALRISMEEERARQQAAEGGPPPAEGAAPATGAPAEGAPAAEGAAAAPAAAPAAPPTTMASDAAVIEAMDMEDMDEELRQALLLSMQDVGPMDTSGAPAAAPAATPAATEPAKADPPKPDAEMTDASKAAAPAEAAPAASSQPAAAAGDAGAPVDTQWFKDPSFVNELLGSLPGVDINDPRIQDALKEVSGEDEKKDEEKKPDEDKK
jgi:26S proteasome regulatory subunit N10